MAKQTKLYLVDNLNGGIIVTTSNSNYGCLNFLWDCFMTCITAGLWLIWVFVREMRKK